MRALGAVLVLSVATGAPVTAQQVVTGGASVFAFSAGQLIVDGGRAFAGGIHYHRIGRKGLGAELSLVGTGGGGFVLLVPSMSLAAAVRSGGAAFVVSGGLSATIGIASGRVGALAGPRVSLAWLGPALNGSVVRVAASAHWYRLEANDRPPVLYLSVGIGAGGGH